VKVILDTRFFVEFFYSKDVSRLNKLKKKLHEFVKNKEGILPAIVVAETVKITCERKGKEVANIRYMSLKESGLKIVSISDEIAKEAGLLKCKYSNVPMGDCIISATAIKEKARVMSDDKHFDEIIEIKRIWIT
jgi:predicted nucleic acid-binding protein